jgi:protein-glutamine gamma-glutamyltransferase
MQSITTRFHRSIYITLGLACACLGYAELAFLPEMSVFAGIVGVLLIAAYRLEGRWALSIRAANVLGGVIAMIAIVWVVNEFLHPSLALVDQLPSPTWLLPYLGPLLMILIPAKLFRPKHDGDFWGLQGIGLIAVSLGCALTGDPLFAVLLLAYVVCGLWSLILFYYYRQARLAGGAAVRPADSPRSLRQAGRWAVAASALALLLFLLTPRATDARWELAGTSFRLQTGVDENRPGIDLNRSGTLTVNRDKVIDVTASVDEAGHIRKIDLDPGQRWRQMVFDSYDGGRWDNRPPAAGNGDQRFGPPPWRQGRDMFVREPRPLPNLGKGQYYLLFRSQTRLVRRLLAEPPIEVFNLDGKVIPTIVSVSDDGQQYRWSRSKEGEYSQPAFIFGGQQHTYKQVTRPLDEPGVSPPTPKAIRDPDDAELDHLRNCQSVPRLAEWSRALVSRLVGEGQLPATVEEHLARGPLPEKDYEVVAHAFERYLALSGDFKYSLNLRRKDVQIDPVEDFVLNSKVGHCTRFATALALMLRSVGVPTRIVLGYRGYETAGDGVYEILQCHAHSWVEARIVRPPTQPEDTRWRWLTLDPTPLTEDTSGDEFSWGQWWEFTRQQVGTLFKNFVIEYDADQQERAKYAMTRADWVIPTNAKRLVLGPEGDDWGRAVLIGLGGLAAMFASWQAVRRWRRSVRPVASPATAFYHRLVAAVGRAYGVVPVIGQTPGEFAATARDQLVAHSATRDVADVPGEAADLYYRVRFGDRPLSAAERQAVDGQLDRLDKALVARHG